MKTCRKCKETKPNDGFWSDASRKDHLADVCKDCRKIEAMQKGPRRGAANRASSRKYRETHKDYFTKRNKDYYQRNKNKVRETNKAWVAKLKIEVLTHYGNGSPTCACCGESHIQMLTLDHINGNGGGRNREYGGASMYGKLRREDYPPGYQVLCFNCNSGRHINGGICPHKTTISRDAGSASRDPLLPLKYEE